MTTFSVIFFEALAQSWRVPIGSAPHLAEILGTFNLQKRTLVSNSIGYGNGT